MRHKPEIILIENHSLNSGSGVAMAQKRTDPVELQERTMAEAKGTETELSGRMYSDGSRGLVSERSVTSSTACTERVGNAERCYQS